MKSTITIPPISLSLSCRAISSAAILLTSKEFSSWLSVLERMPLFTSITLRASVVSMTR